MSEAGTILLGAIAGGTIFLGLPIGPMRRPAPQLRQFLHALAIGILVFLIWDVLAHAYDPISVSLDRLHHGAGSLATVFGYSLLFFSGLGVGLLNLNCYDRHLTRQNHRQAGPGAEAVVEPPATPVGTGRLTAAERLGLLIAIGIGLHNFAEGLAIGQSAAQSARTLATVLVIGFALHNATEGFGIGP